MKSQWEPGARVRVRTTVTDGTTGMTGTIEDVSYARTGAATAVLFDEGQGVNTYGFGAYYRDDELENE